MQQALTAQQSRELQRADALYRRALSVQPDNFNALHMLGVVQLQLGRADDALRLVYRALEIDGWHQQAALHNLGLALAQCVDPKTPSLGMGGLGEAYRSSHPMPRAVSSETGHRMAHAPLVSVIVPNFNCSTYVGDAIKSVFSQTYANWELVVVDDGSTDTSAKVLRQLLFGADPRCRLLTRESRGTAATLNELLALARGSWIHPLNSDGLLAPDRLQRCVEAVSAVDTTWLFGTVLCIDEEGRRIDEMKDTRAFSIRTIQSAVPFEETVGLSFLENNPAISIGNLFFSAELARHVGGFRELKHHLDWDFCLRALCESEPVHLKNAVHYCRLYGHRPNEQELPQRQVEADAIVSQHLETVLSPAHQPKNRWAPAPVHWGERLGTLLIKKGLGNLLPAPRLREMAAFRLKEVLR